MPNLLDQMFGFPGATSLLGNPQDIKRARRQGLLQAGLATLANADRPNPWQAIAAGVGAGQQAYQGQVAGGLQARDEQRRIAGEQAIAQFSQRAQAAQASGNVGELMKVAQEMVALGAQYGITPLMQGGSNIIQQIVSSSTRQQRQPNLQIKDGVNPETGKDEQYSFNPVTGEVQWLGIPPRKQSGSVFTPEDRTRLENQEYDRYYKRAGDIVKRAQSYETITQAAAGARAGNASSQIALVFSFMKMLDPTSVVRESEYATAANAAGVPDRIRNMYNKLLDGVFLTPEQVDNMVNEASAQARGAIRQQGNLMREFRRRAEQRGINPDMVVYDFWEGLEVPEPQEGFGDGKKVG